MPKTRVSDPLTHFRAEEAFGPSQDRFESGPHILLMNDDNENEDGRKVVANNDKTKSAEDVQEDVKASKAVKNDEEGNK